MSNKTKILIAEDDLVSRTMLCSVLSKAGYATLEADSGGQALKIMCQEDAPRLAILDWVLPGLNGLEIVKQLREKKLADPPYLIMLTSKSSKYDLIEALNAGADDYLIKPYDAAVLQARLKVGLRMIKMQREIKEREKLKGVLEMAGAVTHELNQPLQSVFGYAELLMNNLKPEDPHYRILSKIIHGVQRIGELTHKFVTITHYQSKAYLDDTIIDIDKASLKQDGDLL